MVGFMQNTYSAQDYVDLQIITLNTGDGPARVTLHDHSRRLEEVVLDASSFRSHNISSELMNTERTRSNKGLKLESNTTVCVIGINRIAFHTMNSMDAFVAMEYSLLGTQYYAVTGNHSSAILIIGISDNTSVTITLRTNDVSLRYSNKIYKNADVIYENIDEFDVIYIECSGDLSGTSISATNSISVFGGNKWYSFSKVTYEGGHLVEQIPPVEQWGTRYVIQPPEDFGYICTIVAGFDDTDVRVDCTNGYYNSFFLNKIGDTYTIDDLADMCVLTSDKPYLVSMITSKVSEKDPSMVIVQPMENVSEDTLFYVPSGFHSAELVLMTTLNPELIYIDSRPIQSNLLNIDEELFGMRVTVDEGVHTLSAPGFAMSMFGYVHGARSFGGGFETFGYPLNHQRYTATRVTTEMKREELKQEGDNFIPKNSTATDDRQKSSCLRRHPLLIIGLCFTFVVIYTVVLTLGILPFRQQGNDRKENTRKISINVGAVVSDHETCSEIGRDMLKRNGSAVDAAIATLLCDGLMAPHSMGIGGGSFFVIYDAKTKLTKTINARESAPAALTFSQNIQRGGDKKVLTIGVPGEIRGYWEAHKSHGRLPWRDLFLPTIKLAENGHYLSQPVYRAFEVSRLIFGIDLTNNTEFCKIYCDDTGKIAPEGAVIKQPRLAQTLRGIAENGPSYLYEGPIADTIIREIQEKGGVMTKKDLAEYIPVVEDGISVNLGDVMLLTMGAPSGGPVLGLILNILKGVFPNGRTNMETSRMRSDFFHALVEATKLAYGERWKLADPAFVPDVKQVVDKMISDDFAAFLRNTKMDMRRTHNWTYYTNITYPPRDQGTAHVSVLAPDGSAVSVTSSINYYFGSTVMSESTGIIWNNEMTDFSRDNPRNFVEPGKRPLSSMVPAIFVNKAGEVEVVVGGAGGATITPVVSEVSAFLLYLKDSVDKAVRRKRFFQRLNSNTLDFEKGFPQDIMKDLATHYGHEIKESSKDYIAVVQAIARNPSTGEITAFSDERKISGKAKFLTENVTL
ncbi:glutathione hydrolase 1 proenzyme-like [Ylistrum balloti]|uniref:glutathione hydrolase 1 proenzyme-like n=1 Tax=Ylistrum balloti TaxID=509963 RepID=UPI002905D827|nr:glutathione hydrolase 1 proenzyme-like [Ylistrum balloti]